MKRRLFFPAKITQVMDQLTATPKTTVSPLFRTYGIATPRDGHSPELLAGKHAQVLVVRKRRTSVFRRLPKSPLRSPTTQTPKARIASSSTPTPNKRYAIKVQHLRSPKNPNDQGYRELRILKRLSELHSARKCANFIQIEEWHKSLERTKPAGISKSKQLLHIVLEYGHSSLASLKSIELERFRCILFQMVYALGVAQRECGFVHYDLHLRNILLKPAPVQRPFMAFFIEPATAATNRVVYYTSGDVVKIIDFGLSRIELPTGEVLCNQRDQVRTLFSPFEDIVKLARELSRVRITEFGNSDTDSYSSGDSHIELAKQQLKKLKETMRKGKFTDPLALLRDPFFEPLRAVPPGCSEALCMAVAVDGVVPEQWIPHTEQTTVKHKQAVNRPQVTDAKQAKQDECKENVAPNVNVPASNSAKRTKRALSEHSEQSRSVKRRRCISSRELESLKHIWWRSNHASSRFV